MKFWIPWFVLILIAGGLGGALTSQALQSLQAAPVFGPIPEDKEFKTVTARKLSIVDDDGKEVVAIKPFEGGAGIWMQGPNDQTFVVILGKDHKVIGLCDTKAPRRDDNTPAFAVLGFRPGGAPVLSIGHKKTLVPFDLEDLVAVFSGAQVNRMKSRIFEDEMKKEREKREQEKTKPKDPE